MDKKNNSLRRRPQVKQIDSQDFENFISGAEDPKIVQGEAPAEEVKTEPVAKKPVAKKPTSTYPWEGEGIRDDVKKDFVLRLPEKYHLMLMYIAENTPKSGQKFCLDNILPALEKEIKSLTK